MMKLKKSILTLLMLTVSILTLNLATGAYDRMNCIYSIITTADIDTSDADLSLLDEFTDFFRQRSIFQQLFRNGS